MSRYFRDISREASTKTNAWIGNTQGARSTVARACVVSVRARARKQGVGLLEKFGVKKAAAEKKKLAQIKAREDAKLAEEVEKRKERDAAARPTPV